MLAEIIEGDCLDILPHLPDASIDAVICDPPYGTTACKWDSVIPLAPMWEQLRRVTKKAAPIVLFASQPFTSALVMSNPKWFKYVWVWDKVKGNGFMTAKYRPMMRHEDICVFCDGAPSYYPIMTPREVPKKSRCYSVSETAPITNMDTSLREYTHRFPTSIIVVSNASQRGRQHPTQKPVPLMEYLVRTYTQAGAVVLDFACGSGSTGVACVNTGRGFIGIEKEPKYAEISRRRIAEAETLKDAA